MSSFTAFLAGCVSVPLETFSPKIQTQELSDHVYFLSQPALKGRKARSWESTKARKYITNKFNQCGLEPWPQTEKYEQPFGMGTNIIGILPGVDPKLTEEIVILTAHYDHLGKGKKGVYHGACDNASGVSAMLEIAEQLASSKNRPRRTICFASFDSEEKFALGAFIFTCRKDFENKKIVAVVNIDLLGRSFRNVVTNTLLVVGTERYPQLRSSILQTGRKNGIKMLPVGTDVIGPRGDHVAFETMPIPVLFFTCGTYEDYHKPTDTAEKLDYPEMKRTVEVIARTVISLADSDSIEKPVEQTSGDRQELLALMYLIETVISKYDQAGLTEEQNKKLQQLACDIQLFIDEKNYTLAHRKSFARKTIKELYPLVTESDNDEPINGIDILALNEFYAENRYIVNQQIRNMIKHFTKNNPGLFGTTEYKFEQYDLNDNNFRLTITQDGMLELHCLIGHNNVYLKIGGWIFKKPAGGFSFGVKPLDCIGTVEEITDYCLLHWAVEVKDESHNKTLKKLLMIVTSKDLGANYEDWMRWRLEQINLPSKKQWVTQLLNSSNPDLAGQAALMFYKLAEPDYAPAFKVIRNTDKRADVRSKAIAAMDDNIGKEGLLSLTDVLSDQSRKHKDEYFHFFNESHPFFEHSMVVSMRQYYQDEFEKEQTIADMAEDKLKRLTKKDFKKDAAAWQKWIQANW